MNKGIAQPATGFFAALNYKGFRLYFGLRFLYTCAAQMQAMIIGFYAYSITHSTITIAITGLCEVVPAIGLSLYGGYITDRVEKRKLILLIYSAFLFSSVGIYVTTLTSMAAYIPANNVLFVIYGMLFCSGIARAFYEPALFTVYTASIPDEVYSNANNWSSLSWQCAFIIGPIAGGFTYAFAGGISATFAIITSLLLLSVILAFQLDKHPASASKKEPFSKSFFAGIRFVLRHKLMFYTMALDLLSVFFGGVLALLPVYAVDILKVGAEGLGILRTASSVGAVATMLVLLRFPPTAKPWRNLLIAVGGFGAAVICFGLVHNYMLAVVFLFIQGAFDSISVVIRGTIMQLITPEQMRGRVSAVNSMFISSSAELGNVESGITAAFFGTVPAVLIGGGLTLSIVIFTYLKTKNLIALLLTDMSKYEKK